MALLNLDFTPGAINDLSSIELPDIVVIPESEPESNDPALEWRKRMAAKGMKISDFQVTNSPLVQNSFEEAKSKWREATTRRKQIVAQLDNEVLQARKEMDSYR